MLDTALPLEALRVNVRAVEIDDHQVKVSILPTGVDLRNRINKSVGFKGLYNDAALTLALVDEKLTSCPRAFPSPLPHIPC